MPQEDAEQKALIKEWQAWFAGLGTDLVDEGDPYTELTKTIRSEGKVSNEAVERMTSGYSVIRADSLDAAVAMSKGCPVLKSGAKITVYEPRSVMGM
jgi:hypothetical protein